MEAGRGLDREIAEKVMELEIGWLLIGTMSLCWPRDCHEVWPESIARRPIWSKTKFTDVGEEPWDESNPDRHRSLEYQEYGYLKPEPEGPSLQISVPRYSTDIAAAWSVVEKLRGDYDISVTAASPALKGPGHRCELRIPGGDGKIYFGETAPHAICLAALKAVGG